MLVPELGINTVSSRKGLVLLSVVFCFLWGCTFLKETVGIVPTRPRVKLQNIHVNKVTWQKIHLDIEFQIQNPNSFDLKSKNLFYKAMLAERVLLNGHYKQDIFVEARAKSTFRLPLVLDAKDIVPLLFERHGKDSVLKMLVNFDFVTPLGSIAFSIEERKSLKELGLKMKK